MSETNFDLMSDLLVKPVNFREHFLKENVLYTLLISSNFCTSFFLGHYGQNKNLEKVSWGLDKSIDV